MTTILDQTRERFLLAITAQIPAERIAEIHFFPGIKQGGVESGVAVIAVIPEAEVTHERHIVYTARYRHTLKGLDRGKWETNIVAEADAPLITVDAVVRGVQRRIGEADEPERMSGEDLRAVLAARPNPNGLSGSVQPR